MNTPGVPEETSDSFNSGKNYGVREVSVSETRGEWVTPWHLGVTKPVHSPK